MFIECCPSIFRVSSGDRLYRPNEAIESFGDIIESCDYFLFLSLPVGYSFGGGLASKVAIVLLFIL